MTLLLGVHHRRTMKTIRRVSNGWLWFYVASWMLFVSFIALRAGWSSIPPSERYLSPRFTASLAVILLLLSFVSLTSGTLLYAFKSRRALLAPALFLPTFGCMFVSLAFLGPDAYTLVSHDSKYLNGQLYELDSYGLSDYGPPYGNVFADAVVYILIRM
jgi:heme/copper-type cytochrome/quinol oxidase subunit 3